MTGFENLAGSFAGVVFLKLEFHQLTGLLTSFISTVKDLVSPFSRDDWIRTSDPLHPMQVRYRAALRPENLLSKGRKNTPNPQTPQVKCL
jgi:hypothetical protein